MNEETNKKLMVLKYSLEGELKKKGYSGIVQIDGMTPSDRESELYRVMIRGNFPRKTYIVWRPHPIKGEEADWYWEDYDSSVNI